jgi:hypothetical protein
LTSLVPSLWYTWGSARDKKTKTFYVMGYMPVAEQVVENRGRAREAAEVKIGRWERDNEDVLN